MSTKTEFRHFLVRPADARRSVGATATWCAVASVLIVLAVATQPAEGSCASGVSYFYSSSYPDPYYPPYHASHVSTPGIYMAYCPEPMPESVSHSFTGVFWALGLGDPVVGSGVDNGEFESRWCAYGSGCFGWVVNEFCYPPFIAGEWYYSWQEVDGCIADLPGRPCMGVLLTDGGVFYGLDGHFALLTRQEDVHGNFPLDRPGFESIVLSPIPRPTTVASTRSGGTSVEVTIASPSPDDLVDGLFLDDDCGDSPLEAYRVHAQGLPHGSPPPVDRRISSGWTPLDVTPLGVETSASLDCVEDTDIYLAMSLISDLVSGGGFKTQHLSGNSEALCCGPTVPDLDSDAYCAGGPDCDDTNGQVWAIPGEVRELRLVHDSATGETTLEWVAPAGPGGTPAATAYDTLRSADPEDFLNSTFCVESNDAGDTEAVDWASPSEGAVFYYLIRAENVCGEGSMGVGSGGFGREGRDCS